MLGLFVFTERSEEQFWWFRGVCFGPDRVKTASETSVPIFVNNTIAIISNDNLPKEKTGNKYIRLLNHSGPVLSFEKQ